MAVESPEIVDISVLNTIPKEVEIVAEPAPIDLSNKNSLPSSEQKVSALSLASIRAKREILENNKSLVKESVHLPTEPFNETDLLVYWNKYAQRLGDKGLRIMEALLTMSTPILKETSITVELSNESSKIDFESEINGLLGYLKGHLHNHDIEINVIVNESIENKFAFTPQDKYNRLNEINPNLELLRRTFDLDL